VTGAAVLAACATATVASAQPASTAPVAAAAPAAHAPAPAPAGSAFTAPAAHQVLPIPAQLPALGHAPVVATDISYDASAGSPQVLARSMVPADQYQSFSNIVSHESGWNVHATNPSSGAYGLGQALPGGKMASAGPDWHDNAATQIRWTLGYMNSRYGSPNAAWAFWQAHHWY
jgi:hypothetical protein